MITFDNILLLLEESGKTQKELAEYIGVAKSRITDWKSGRVNSYTKYLPQIAEFLGVSVNTLIGNATHTPRPHKNVLRVPVYGRVAAGIPMEDIEDIDDYGEKYMFYENFLQLCSQKSVYPNTVTSELGLSAATATSWKKGAVPREVTLKKIADYFGVSVDYLLGKEQKEALKRGKNMFKENFVRLCNQRGVAPTAVCTAIGLQKSAFSNWDDTSVPRQSTLIKISDYFGVSVDYLLGKEPKEKPVTNGDEQFEEIWDLFSRLSPAEQDQAMKYLEFLHATSSSKKP